MPGPFRPALVAALVFAASAAAADPTPDPLRFIPKDAGLVLKVEKPRHLVEAVTTLAAFKDGTALPAVREALDGTATRRALQLLAHVERETGATWPRLLDQLAGGGMALGVSYGSQPEPALLVMQGTDEPAAAKAFDLLLRTADDELARTGSPERVARDTTKGAAVTARVGKDLHLARHGTTVFVANRADALDAGLALAAGGSTADSVLSKPTVSAAKASLPADPLAWVWVDFAAAKETKATKDFLDNTRKDFLGNLVLGGTLDCLRRSDFVAVGLHKDTAGFRLALRLPAGRDAFGPELGLHVPPAGTPGSPAPLDPPGTLYSQSFHLDFGAWWTHRDKLLDPKMKADFEKAEKDISKFLPGAKLGEMLTMWGVHHRVVVVNTDKLPYTTEPPERLPAFGYVTGMKDAKFGKSLDGIVRATGFLLSLQYGLKQSETVVDGVKVLSYRFPEGKPYPGDDGNVRFNFEPAFAVVGGEAVFASTLELMKKLVPEVRRTAKLPGSDVVWRGRAAFAPAADAVAAYPDAAVTDAILRQGVGIDEARRQVAKLVDYLRTLGTLGVTVDEAATRYKLDVVWEIKTN